MTPPGIPKPPECPDCGESEGVENAHGLIICPRCDFDTYLKPTGSPAHRAAINAGIVSQIQPEVRDNAACDAQMRDKPTNNER